MADQERLYDVRDAAQYLGLHPVTVREKAKAGVLRSLRAGNRYRFTRADLDAYLQRGEIDGQEG